MYPSIAAIVEAAKEILEVSPPEVLGDIINSGIILTGGGALIRNIEKLFEIQLKVKTVISQNALMDVATGCGFVLNEIEKYEQLVIKNADEVSFVK